MNPEESSVGTRNGEDEILDQDSTKNGEDEVLDQDSEDEVLD